MCGRLEQFLEMPSLLSSYERERLSEQTSVMASHGPSTTFIGKTAQIFLNSSHLSLDNRCLVNVKAANLTYNPSQNTWKLSNMHLLCSVIVSRIFKLNEK